jgi:hypothetical protein
MRHAGKAVFHPAAQHIDEFASGMLKARITLALFMHIDEEGFEPSAGPCDGAASDRCTRASYLIERPPFGQRP